jgi:phage FluMu gp28-like protein
VGAREEAAFAAWRQHAFVDYQRDWIDEPSPFAIGLKSRQIGFSDATSGGCVAWGLGRGRPQLVLSASQDLSDELLRKSKEHCRLLAQCGHRGALDLVVDNTTEIAWRSGGRIVALPANPRTARSFAGDVWLDEFAYHADPDAIRDGAFAMASTGDYRIRVFSTPNGAQGLFYEWATNPPDGWELHHVTVDDAAAQGFPVNLEKLFQLCGGDERVFAQWYRCRFLDADLQYVPTAMADRARAWKGLIPSLAGAEIHAGLDVARKHDLTALTIIAVINGIAWVIAILTCKRTDFRAQKRMIVEARRVFRWITLHVDETGLGAQLAEELVEKWGDDEVRRVNFTNQAKADLATRALRWLRDTRIRYPRDAQGEALYAETIAVRRKVTPANNVVFEVPRTAKGHGDRWWSMCLALKGAGEPPTPRGMGEEPLLAVA